MMTTATTLAFSTPGWGELLVLAILGLLIFGKRLPEVGKSLGKGIVEFKKGLAGIEDDVDKATKTPAKRLDADDVAHRETHAEPRPDAQSERQL